MSTTFKKFSPITNFSLKNVKWDMKFLNLFAGVKLYQYSLKDNARSYYLISKQCLNYDFKKKYLEDFLHDFQYCDWQNNSLVNQYIDIFKEVNPKLFPKYYCVKHNAHVHIEMEKEFNQALESLDDHGFLEDKIGIMKFWLDAVRNQENMYDDLKFQNTISSINNTKSKLGL